MALHPRPEGDTGPSRSLPPPPRTLCRLRRMKDSGLGGAGVCLASPHTCHRSPAAPNASAGDVGAHGAEVGPGGETVSMATRPRAHPHPRALRASWRRDAVAMSVKLQRGRRPAHSISGLPGVSSRGSALPVVRTTCAFLRFAWWSVDGPLGSFRIPSVANDSAVNTEGRVSRLCLAFLRADNRRWNRGAEGGGICVFGGDATPLSAVAAPSALRPAVHEGPVSPHPACTGCLPTSRRRSVWQVWARLTGDLAPVPLAAGGVGVSPTGLQGLGWLVVYAEIQTVNANALQLVCCVPKTLSFRSTCGRAICYHTRILGGPRVFPFRFPLTRVCHFHHRLFFTHVPSRHGHREGSRSYAFSLSCNFGD